MKQFLLWILKEIDPPPSFHWVCHTLSSLVPKTVEPRAWTLSHSQGTQSPKQSTKMSSYWYSSSPDPVPTPAEAVSWVSCVTNQRLVFWQLLSQGTPPQHPEEEVVLVSRTKKKTFFFLFHSLKSQAHKKEYKLHPAALISVVKNCYFQLYCLKKNSNASIF